MTALLTWQIVIWSGTEYSKACEPIEAPESLMRWVCIDGPGWCGIKKVVLGDW